jgi:hypothetical protein
LNVLAAMVLRNRIIKAQFDRRKEFFPIRRFGKAYGGLCSFYGRRADAGLTGGAARFPVPQSADRNVGTQRSLSLSRNGERHER